MRFSSFLCSAVVTSRTAQGVLRSGEVPRAQYEDLLGLVTSVRLPSALSVNRAESPEAPLSKWPDSIVSHCHVTSWLCARRQVELAHTINTILGVVLIVYDYRMSSPIRRT